MCAVAGGWKSTVLRQYARARPSLGFLFLSFNASVRIEKEEEFSRLGLQNIVVHTLHSFALQSMDLADANEAAFETSNLISSIQKQFR